MSMIALLKEKLNRAATAANAFSDEVTTLLSGGKATENPEVQGLRTNGSAPHGHADAA